MIDLTEEDVVRLAYRRGWTLGQNEVLVKIQAALDADPYEDLYDTIDRIYEILREYNDPAGLAND